MPRTTIEPSPEDGSNQESWSRSSAERTRVLDDVRALLVEPDALRRIALAAVVQRAVGMVLRDDVHDAIESGASYGDCAAAARMSKATLHRATTKNHGPIFVGSKA